MSGSATLRGLDGAAPLAVQAGGDDGVCVGVACRRYTLRGSACTVTGGGVTGS